MIINLRTGAAIVALVVLDAGVAQAQAPAQPAPAVATAAADADAGLDDIVVTAQKRSENLQKVPVAVTSFSSDAIQARGASNLLELQRLSPSLTVQNTASNVSPFIRGVGTTVTGAGQSGSVATYVDGVYIATLTSAAFDLDTAEQVQVLSGPQGALYGRNATGGAIVVSTHTPHGGDDLSARFRAEVGNYNSRVVSGSISSGLGDKFGIYLAGSYRKHDGYIENLNPVGAGAHHDDLNDRDAWSINGALSFEPTDQLSFVLRASHFESDDRFGVGLQAVGLDLNLFGTGLNGSQLYYAGVLQSLGVPAANAFGAAGALTFSNKFGASYDNAGNGFARGVLGGSKRPGSFVALNVDNVSFKASYEFDTVAVSSLTSYSKAKSLAATEVIFANPATYPAGFQNGSVGFSGNFPSRNIQEDFQISSVGTPVKWIAGIFYLNNRGDVSLSGDLPPLSALTALNRWTSKSIAGYAQATVPLSDVWSITGGARYTKEKYRIDDYLTLSNPLNLFGIPNSGVQDSNSSQVTYTARVEHSSGPLLLYAGVATGFKGAVRSPVNPFSPGVSPEKIISFEGGAKWNITPSARLNGSIFHYIYKNIQIAYTDSVSGSNILVNGTGAKLTGGEIQGDWRANDWLTLRTSGLLLDSSYNRDVQSIGGTVPVLQTGGKRLAGAPKFTLAGGADILVPLGSASLLFAADVTYNDGYYFDAENLVGTGGANAASFTTVDLSLTYKASGDRWEIAAFGTNVTNEKYFQSGLPVSSTVRSALAASPALYGVRASVKF